MGRRKSRAKIIQRKVVYKVPTVFDCPFCNHDKTVECQMLTKEALANIRCRICGASWQMRTDDLTEPIDVYSEWIDKCEEENGREEGEEDDDLCTQAEM